MKKLKQENRGETGATHRRAVDSGSTFTGLLIGFVIGLALALVLAIYVTKVPVPFLNKTQTRSADQDAVEAKKNKDWDPNSALYGKNPAKAADVANEPNGSTDTDAKVNAPVAAPSAAAVAPAAPPAVATQSKAPAKTEAGGSDPLADLIKSKAGESAAEPFNYFVQVGAYNKAEEAEKQKAQLALSGLEVQLSTREQGAGTVYRVRLGPFANREQAEELRKKLEDKGTASILVKTQR